MDDLEQGRRTETRWCSQFTFLESRSVVYKTCTKPEDCHSDQKVQDKPRGLLSRKTEAYTSICCLHSTLGGVRGACQELSLQLLQFHGSQECKPEPGNQDPLPGHSCKNQDYRHKSQGTTRSVYAHL